MSSLQDQFYFQHKFRKQKENNLLIPLVNKTLILSGLNLLVFILLLDGADIYEVALAGVYVPVLLFVLADKTDC